MSLPRKMTVNCSKCGKPLMATVFQSVNTDYTDNVAGKIISGELFDVACPYCGFVSHLEYDTLYHDMKHGAMIWVLHKRDPKYASKLAEIRATEKIPYKTLRVVENMNALKEKVSCLEQGRDDRIIELCKAYITADILEQEPDFAFRNTFYTIATGQELIFLYDKDGNNLYCELRAETYEELKELYENSPYATQFDGNYAAVDFAWAKELLPLLEEAEKAKDNTAESSVAMTCSKCGKELPAGSKFCQYCGSPITEEQPTRQMPVTVNTPQILATAVPTVQKAPSVTTLSEQPTKTKKESKRHIVLPIILGVLLLFSAGLNIVQYKDNISLEVQIDDKEKSLHEKQILLGEKIATINDLRNENWKLTQDGVNLTYRLNFYEENCAIAPEDSRFYHVYGCEKWTGGRFWLYNVALAEGKGYTPCPNCH